MRWKLSFLVFLAIVSLCMCGCTIAMATTGADTQGFPNPASLPVNDVLASSPLPPSIIAHDNSTIAVFQKSEVQLTEGAPRPFVSAEENPNYAPSDEVLTAVWQINIGEMTDGVSLYQNGVTVEARHISINHSSFYLPSYVNGAILTNEVLTAKSIWQAKICNIAGKKYVYEVKDGDIINTGG